MKIKLPHIVCFFLGVAVGYLLLPILPSLVEYLCSAPALIMAYWIFWILVFSLIIAVGSIKTKGETASETEEEENNDDELETKWNKSLGGTSLVLLSACAYGLFYESHFISKNGISVPVVLLALSSLFTLASSAFLPLSEYFDLSWPWQAKSSYHIFLHRISMRVALYWHSVPLLFCLIQLMSASYIILALYPQS